MIMETKSGSIWALSDFHLPSSRQKYQNLLGDIWDNHLAKISENVNRLMKPDDYLLVSGDISWAYDTSQMEDDFKFMASLPCKLVLSEGNHDSWTNSKGFVKSLPPNVIWNQCNCFVVGDVAIASVRLWDFDGIFPWPGHFKAKGGSANTERREINKLTKTLGMMPKGDGIKRILMTHFPPLSFDAKPGVLTKIINENNVDICVYGHVHAQKKENAPVAVNTQVGNTRFILTSADWLEMEPIHIADYLQI